MEMDASKAREMLKSYLSKRLRVEVSDGRIIEGNFMCTDRDRNIVLGSCEEFYGRQEMEQVESCPPDRSRRTLGMAIVPGEHIRNISMATSTNAIATETSSTTTRTSTSSPAPADLPPTQTSEPASTS